MVRQYSKNDAISWNWLSNSIGWPLSTPRTITDMVHLEAVFDVMDLYLWLRFIICLLHYFIHFYCKF